MNFLDFLFISLFLWQSVVGLWILLIWVSRNFKFRKSPNLNIGEVVKTSVIEETKVKKDLGPVEVDVKREFKVDTEPDEKSVKVDEKIKGKVKTQKDKLRSLRK